MKDFLGAPIKNIKNQGYYYDLTEGEHFELPGLWFSPQEIIALSLFEQLSECFQPAVIKKILDPLHNRLEKLLEEQKISPQNWQTRIKIVAQWQRPCQPEHFSRIAYALLHRQQIEIDYWQWQTDTKQKRCISPQRIIYYRDNWYLDAWCHLRQALRTFSIDAIKQTQKIDQKAIDISAEELDKHVLQGYGIFAGKVIGHARLKFSKEISSRVSRENWHPEQEDNWTKNGQYLLTIPYSDPRELIRDILRYGADVKVLGPESLRNSIRTELEQALKKYI
jgi:predicted DNA-binding transcriptional regulator YafY